MFEDFYDFSMFTIQYNKHYVITKHFYCLISLTHFYIQVGLYTNMTTDTGEIKL